LQSIVCQVNNLLKNHINPIRIILYLYPYKLYILFQLKYLNIWYLLIPFLIFTSCKNNTIPTGEVSASVIEYKVTYLSEKAGSIPTKMLPGKMTVIFAGHFVLNRIEGFFGQFSLMYIGNLKKKSVITMLKLFDKKYVYYGKNGELPCGFSELKNLSIEETGNTRDLLGLNCKELLISSDENQSFYILCSDEIEVKNPNVTTPFKKIEEVLLEFNTKLSMLDMKLTATSIQEKKISWDIFRVAEDYKERPKEFMENTIHELFK